MLEARFRPLPKWPGKLLYRSAQFKMNYMRVLDDLESELRRIKARDITIEAGFSAADLRNDGWPRAGTKTSHPGVILYCHTPDGPLKFACGTYGKFEDNMHAIGLTLEALRAVDRYGATEGHEQYRGFAALPAAADVETVRGWTLHDAAFWLAGRTDWAADGAQLLASYDSFRRAYKEAATRLHPDTPGGSEQGWAALQAVERIFERHFTESFAGGAL